MVALLAAFSSRRPDVAIQTAHKTYSGREEHCLQRFNKRLQRPELGWNDRVDCKVKRIHSANRYKLRAECEAVDIARKRLVEGCATLICIASMTIGAHAALAEPPMPAAITEVPAAINSINTENNAQLQQEQDAVDQAKSASTGQDEQNRQVSIDFSADGQPLGKVVIKVFPEPPLGTQRFLDLAERRAGGYRLSRVDGISDGFVTVSGILQLNYTGIAELTGGETVEELEAERTLYKSSHDKAGLVSLIVEDAGPKDVRDRVVAYQGRLIKVQEVRGSSNANGTGFAISLGPTPLLDKTNLIIGQVTEGLEVVERISKLPRVKSSSKSPFFQVAKVLGDRRADVAARSFGKPFGKIVIDKITVDPAEKT